jgi:hypothetical protein
MGVRRKRSSAASSRYRGDRPMNASVILVQAAVALSCLVSCKKVTTAPDLSGSGPTTDVDAGNAGTVTVAKVSATAQASGAQDGAPEPASEVGSPSVEMKTSKENCEAWTEHLNAVTKSSLDDLVAACLNKAPAGTSDVAKKKEQKLLLEGDAASRKTLDEQTTWMNRDCATTAGKSYMTADSACFMRAKKVEDWNTCAFPQTFFGGYANVGRMLTTAEEYRCPY